MAKKAPVKKKAQRTPSAVSLDEMKPAQVSEPTKQTHSSMRNFLIPAVILVVALGYLFKSYIVAATVNGQPVTRVSVVKELEKQGGKKVLDAIVTKMLIEQEAKKKNVVVMDKDIDSEVAKIEQNISSQGSTLDSALKAQGMTLANLKEEIVLQLTLQKLVGDDVTVTDKEVDEYIEGQRQQAGDQFQEPERDQVKQALKLQKQQADLQAYVENLRKQAKVNYFVQYQ